MCRCFVIKPGCTAKESWDCGEKMLFSAEKRDTNTWNSKLEILWQNTRETSRIRALRGFHYSVSHSLEQSFRRHGVDSGFAKTWDLGVCVRMWPELWSRRVSIWGLLTSLSEERRRRLSKQCHSRCSWEFEGLSFRQSSAQTLTTLHPKWTTIASPLEKVFEPLPTRTTYDEAFNRKEEFRSQAVPE